MITLLHIVPAEFPEQIIRYLFGFICHQDSNILVSLGGHQLPLCPRCLGMHTGFFLLLIVTRLFSNIKHNILNPRNLIVILIAVSIAGIHWLMGAEGIIKPDFMWRILTGFLSGAALSLLLTGLTNPDRLSQIRHFHRRGIFGSFVVIELLAIVYSPYLSLLITIFMIVIINIIIVIRSLRTVIRLILSPEYIRGTIREVQK